MVESTLMSKGHGRAQLHVLRELAEAAANPHSRDWVAVVEMGWSSRAKKQAVRRAMKRLAEEGYVVLAPDLERGLGVLEPVVPGDDRLEVDLAGRRQRDRGGLRVGVAEGARDP